MLLAHTFSTHAHTYTHCPSTPDVKHLLTVIFPSIICLTFSRKIRIKGQQTSFPSWEWENISSKYFEIVSLKAQKIYFIYISCYFSLSADNQLKTNNNIDTFFLNCDFWIRRKKWKQKIHVDKLWKFPRRLSVRGKWSWKRWELACRSTGPCLKFLGEEIVTITLVLIFVLPS